MQTKQLQSSFFQSPLIVGSRSAVVSAALLERTVVGSIPMSGNFHTVGPCKKAVFACLATDLYLFPLQWIPFLMFETLNSCRHKLVCAKIMPNVGKNLSRRALLPKFKKNKKMKQVSS